MKQFLVASVRKLLPVQLVHRLEDLYRRIRILVIGTLYGWPARSLHVIAVTGTNGKTTTANYLNAILKTAGKRTAMFSTALIEIDGETRANDLNATVAPTAVMQRFFREAKRANVDYVVMEFPSHALHQHKLDYTPIEVAIMTNLTQDHLDYHKTMEEYAAAKAQLFAMQPRHSILNRDDSWFDYFNKAVKHRHLLTYGKQKQADIGITKIKHSNGQSSAVFTLDGTKLSIQSPLPGEFNLYNLAAAVAAAYALGIDTQAIQTGTSHLKGIPGRYERIEAGQDYDIVVDYAHTPDGLEKLLDTARTLTKGRVLLVFGACGDRDRGKRPQMGEIAAQRADQIILTDEESYNEDPKQIREMIYDGIKTVQGGTKKTTEIEDRRDAIQKALSIARDNDTILITGMGHEVYRIVNGKRVPWNDAQVVRELLNVNAAAPTDESA